LAVRAGEFDVDEGGAIYKSETEEITSSHPQQSLSNGQSGGFSGINQTNDEDTEPKEEQDGVVVVDRSAYPQSKKPSSNA
jgi:hypothetical protein